MSVDPVSLRRSIGYVIQQVGLFPHWTIAENIATVPKLLGWDEGRIAARVDELLERVGMEPATFRARFPRELSGGQKQRVGVARALAADPPVMLMDEPFAALDPISRGRLQDEFLRLLRDLRKTIVFVTQDIDEALKLGDRIAIMKDGKFIQVGTPEEVVAHPADDYVADFTRDVPRAHVLTARTIMRQPNGDADYAGDVASSMIVQDLLPLVVSSDRPFRVVDDGAQIGVVDRAAVLSAMVEKER